MDPDLSYLEELIAAGEGFTYRRARKHDSADPTFEYSADSWIEWLTKAEMALKTFSPTASEALEHIREAKHLNVIGDLPDDFYRSRELALSALRICARQLRQPVLGKRSKSEPIAATDKPVLEKRSKPKPITATDKPVLEKTSKSKPITATDKPVEENATFWDHYGKPIAVGIAATVIGGLLLALLL